MENSQSYRDVKNFIHNDLGITKEYVEEVIKNTVQKEIHTLFNDENRLTYIIENMIRKEIRQDQNKTLYHLLLNFDSLLDRKITETVFNEVKSRLKIELVEEDLDANKQ